MTVTTKGEVGKLLELPFDKGPLIITPLLDKCQIGESSIDLRLGNEFIVYNKAHLTHCDVANFDLSKWTDCHKRVRLRLRQKFVLHPSQFVLASTLEYVSLPNTHAGYVTGRSTWGRTGLIIETAAFIEPKFQGVITLELANSGEIPLSYILA
jgi:dCTP deaminase